MWQHNVGSGRQCIKAKHAITPEQDVANFFIQAKPSMTQYA